MCEECGCHEESAHSVGDSIEHTHEHEHQSSHDHEHQSSHDTDTDQENPPKLEDHSLRIAVTGKGGVGKTTVSAALASRLAIEHDVIAVDADPDMNLATMIGCEQPPPITRQRERIEERTGTSGGLIRLSPVVEDLINTHSSTFGDTGRLITIGAPAAASSGCMCPENNVVRSLVRSALDSEFTVLDMEAGIEHLGRGTAADVDVMIVVVGPSQSAIETAAQIRGLAAEMHIQTVYAVVNGVSESTAEIVEEAVELPVLETIPHHEDIAHASLSGDPPVEASDLLRRSADRILRALVDEITDRSNTPVTVDD